MSERSAVALLSSALILASFVALGVPAAGSHWCAPSSVTLSPGSGSAGASALLSYELHNGISDTLEVDDFYVTYSWDSTTSTDLGSAILSGYASKTFSETVVLPAAPGQASILVEVRGYASPDYASSLCTYGPMEFLILASSAPSVLATASPSRGDPPLAVHLNATASGGTSPYRTFTWNPGDGTASILGQNVVHTYPVSGIYRAQVVVTDSAFRTAAANVTVTVLGFLATNASASASQGAAPMRISFGSTTVGGTPPYRYAWDFGDGGSSTEPTTDHTYAEPGEYDVILTVLDAAGHSATSTVHVSVVPGPAPPGDLGTSFRWLAAGIVVVAAVGGVAAFLILRRRRTPPPPAP